MGAAGSGITFRYNGMWLSENSLLSISGSHFDLSSTEQANTPFYALRGGVLYLSSDNTVSGGSLNSLFYAREAGVIMAYAMTALEEISCATAVVRVVSGGVVSMNAAVLPENVIGPKYRMEGGIYNRVINGPGTEKGIMFVGSCR